MTNTDSAPSIEEIYIEEDSQKKQLKECLMESQHLFKLYNKSNSNVKLIVRELIKTVLIINGINLEIQSGCESEPLKNLRLAFKDGVILNLNSENLVLIKPKPELSQETILSAADGADSVTQIMQRLQKSPQNKNLRFRIEKILSSKRIILPP